jgi:hypothetical protein
MDETTGKQDEAAAAPAGPAAAAPGEPARKRRTAAALVAIGVVILEPELIPGIAIGAALALAPRYLPRLASAVRERSGPMKRATRTLTEKAQALGARAKERASHVVHRVSPAERERAAGAEDAGKQA